MPPRVSSYMSTPVIVVGPQDTVAHVRNLMLRYRVGRVIVVDADNKPIGMVTKKGVVKAIAQRRSLAARPIDTIPVQHVMEPVKALVKPASSITTAAKLMVKYAISGLPVVEDEGRLIGVITKTDLVKAYSERWPGKYVVSDFMLRDVPTASPYHTIFYVLDVMINGPISKVVVLDNNRVIGIIAESDVAFFEYIAPLTFKAKYRKVAGRAPRGRVTMVREYLVPVAKDIMTPDPVTVREDEDLALAAKAMLEHRVSSLPVVDEEERLKGLITKMRIVKALASI